MNLSLPATTTATAATECLRRRGAGNKLPALLKTLQEDNLSEDVEVSVEASGGDSGDSEVPMKCSSKEGKPKPGDAGENVKPILCCVCSKRVLDSETVVRCSLDDKQCEAIAHASCAGYTTRGASRAKFLCADHRASKLLQGSKSKLKSQSKGNRPATSSRGKQQPPVTPSTSDSHDPCLCAVEGTCVSCCAVSTETGSTSQGDNEDLRESFKLLTVKFQDLELSHKRENKELCMHVLVLEERIHSLEEEVKGLRSKLPINQMTGKPEVNKKRKAMPRPWILSHPVLLQVICLVV